MEGVCVLFFPRFHKTQIEILELLSVCEKFNRTTYSNVTIAANSE